MPMSREELVWPMQQDLVVQVQGRGSAHIEIEIEIEIEIGIESKIETEREGLIQRQTPWRCMLARRGNGLLKHPPQNAL